MNAFFPLIFTRFPGLVWASGGSARLKPAEISHAFLSYAYRLVVFRALNYIVL